MQLAGPERPAQWPGVEPGNLHVKPRPRAVLMQVAPEPCFGNQCQSTHFLNWDVSLHHPGVLRKMQVPVQQVGGGSPEAARLARSR